MKLDRKQDLNALYQVCVFWADRKNKMATLASDWLRHFWLLLWNSWTEFSKTWQEASSQCLLPGLCFSGKLGKNKMAALASDWLRHFRLLLWNCERNTTKLDRKQDLNALNQVCVFQVARKNKMAALAYDLLRHFQLFLWNRWIEFNKTWQEARSQCPLPGLRFSGWSEKQDSRPVLWLAETFLTSPMNHRTKFNETWQKASSQRPLPSLCFSGWSKKQYGGPGLWLAETYFDFSPETAERNSAKLDRKQDLNVLYQVCVFWAEKWIKIATPANTSK